MSENLLHTGILSLWATGPLSPPTTPLHGFLAHRESSVLLVAAPTLPRLLCQLLPDDTMLDVESSNTASAPRVSDRKGRKFIFQDLESKPILVALFHTKNVPYQQSKNNKKKKMVECDKEYWSSKLHIPG